MIWRRILNVKITKQVKWGFCLKYSPNHVVFLTAAHENCHGEILAMLMAVSYLLLQVVRACAGVLTNVSSAVKVRLKSYCTCLLMWHHLTYNSMIFTLWYNALGDPFICYWLYLANKYQWDICFKVNFLSNWKLTFFFPYASCCNKDPQLTLCFKCNYLLLSET